MKVFFISDIHGSAYFLEKALKKFEEEKADHIVILGDILYHGARNDLPKGYAPKKVIELLNERKNYITAVQGNCDSYVDGMVLKFPIDAPYSQILTSTGKRIFMTHGHLYNQDKMPPLPEGTAFIYGHTHIYRAEKEDGFTFINPGSISIPKGGNPGTYGVLEDGIFYIKDLEGNPITSVEI